MKSFSNETLNSSQISVSLSCILPKLYQLCESCRRNLLETL